MSAYPEPLPEVVNFPDPRLQHKKISLPKPSIDQILRLRRQGADGTPRIKLVLPSEQAPRSREVKPPPGALIDDRADTIERQEEELREKQREFSRVQAETLERLRAAKELEILLASRENLLNEREALLDSRLADPSGRGEITSLQKSLEETRNKLSAALKQLDERNAAFTALEGQLQQVRLQAQGTDSSGSGTGFSTLSDVSHPSLEEQVAFLREREAFIEESENVLFNKAQELQEWETRLQQMEHDQGAAASSGSSGIARA